MSVSEATLYEINRINERKMGLVYGLERIEMAKTSMQTTCFSLRRA